MAEHGHAGRVLATLAVVVLAAGCGAGASPSPSPAAPTPASVPSAAAATPAPAAAPTPAATATAAPSPSVVETGDVAYESSNPLLEPGLLDVYAPAKAGPWPVVVMFHGQPVSKGFLAEHARRVAELGFVVFVPAWGHVLGGTAGPPDYDQLVAINAQAACAVAFAGTSAAAYGGDPATMLLFGHSAGANTPGGMVAFAPSKPSAGCLGGATVGAIGALIAWEGDWVLGDPQWDSVLDADPGVMDVATPLSHLGRNKGLRVVLLVSDNPGPYGHSTADPQSTDAFFKVRDPSGHLRKTYEAIGAFADGKIDITEEQKVFLSLLRAQGNRASLDLMPGSTHESLGDEGWKVFLAAFQVAAAKD